MILVVKINDDSEYCKIPGKEFPPEPFSIIYGYHSHELYYVGENSIKAAFNWFKRNNPDNVFVRSLAM